MQRIRQKGFALVEILLVLVIVGIIAFVAWRVIVASGEADNAQSGVPTSTETPGGNDVPAVNNTNDLTKLEQQLNNAQIDDSTANDLDTETTF